MPTRDQRIRADIALRERYRTAAAQLRAALRPHMTQEHRDLIIAAAVICEAVSLGADPGQRQMRQGIDSLAEVADRLANPRPPGRGGADAIGRIDGPWARPGYTTRVPPPSTEGREAGPD